MGLPVFVFTITDPVVKYLLNPCIVLSLVAFKWTE